MDQDLLYIQQQYIFFKSSILIFRRDIVNITKGGISYICFNIPFLYGSVGLGLYILKDHTLNFPVPWGSRKKSSDWLLRKKYFF